MKPTLLILAAGMGSRYGGLKQVDPVGPHGEVIIEYSLYDAIAAGFGKVVFVIREQFKEAFDARFRDKFEDKIEIVYAFQEVNSPIEGINDPPPREKPWGTAHAVLVAEDVVNEPFAVINADDFYGPSSFKICADFLINTCAREKGAMVGYVLNNTLSDHGTVNRGVCQSDEDGNLSAVKECIKIEKHPDKVQYPGADGEMIALDPNSHVSMNFWAFHPAIFKTMKAHFIDFVDQNRDKPKAEFFIPLHVDHLIKSKKASFDILPCDEQWYGVTYQEDKPKVQAALKSMADANIYPAPLWKV